MHLQHYDINPKQIMKLGATQLKSAVKKSWATLIAVSDPKLYFYRNNLIHGFINEALIVVSLYGFGEEPCFSTGVQKGLLWEKTKFLVDLLDDEYVVEDLIESEDKFDVAIEETIKNGVLVSEGD